MGDQSKHMATRAVSTCTRMMILGLFLGVLAVTSEPTDMHDPGQVEAKLTNEVIPESEWGPVEFLERPARGSDKKPPELQLSQAGVAAKARLEAAKNGDCGDCVASFDKAGGCTEWKAENMEKVLSLFHAHIINSDGCATPACVHSTRDHCELKWRCGDCVASFDKAGGCTASQQ